MRLAGLTGAPRVHVVEPARRHAVPADGVLQPGVVGLGDEWRQPVDVGRMTFWDGRDVLCFFGVISFDTETPVRCGARFDVGPLTRDAAMKGINLSSFHSR